MRLFAYSVLHAVPYGLGLVVRRLRANLTHTRLLRGVANALVPYGLSDFTDDGSQGVTRGEQGCGDVGLRLEANQS